MKATDHGDWAEHSMPRSTLGTHSCTECTQPYRCRRFPYRLHDLVHVLHTEQTTSITKLRMNISCMHIHSFKPGTKIADRTLDKNMVGESTQQAVHVHTSCLTTGLLHAPFMVVVREERNAVAQLLYEGKFFGKLNKTLQLLHINTQLQQSTHHN